MKQDNNNEIDLLLRSLARDGRAGKVSGMAPVSGFEDQTLSGHLDTDELNSFAEGLVPATARIRYLEHLADCESCRGVVINLTQAAGVAAKFETLEERKGAGFWHKLAFLFSPPVLRYAVPLVALTTVIALSFFALRERSSPDLVAKDESRNSAAQVPALRQEADSLGGQSASGTPGKGRPESSPALEFRSDKRRSQGEAPGAVQPEANTGADAGAGSKLKDASLSKPTETVDVARPVFSTEPAAAPPPPKTVTREADKAGTPEKEELVRGVVQDLPREAQRNQPRDEAGRHGPSRSNTEVTTRRADGGLMAERQESKAQSKKDSDDEVETRTVAGRRFRRQGSVWIDTAYDSSRGTHNISRGSERFRALVADEPGIRTIAEKLNGVVIVVWNGRAYRIQ